jgi:hypothetical protein
MGYLMKIKKDHNPLVNMDWDFDDEEITLNSKSNNVKDLVDEYAPERVKINDVYSAFDGYDFKEY